MANYVIILAAGGGKRLDFNKPKCFININNKPIYWYCLEKFKKIHQLKQIILVVPPKYISKIHINKVKIVAGGKTRNNSFENAIKAIKNLKPNDKLIIHDAARINIQTKDILKIIKSKSSFGTLCFIGKKNKSDLHIGKYNIQTPQFCSYSIYKHAKKNKKGRDLFTYLNLKPKNSNFIISSNKSENFKITFQKDLTRAKNTLL